MNDEANKPINAMNTTKLTNEIIVSKNGNFVNLTKEKRSSNMKKIFINTIKVKPIGIHNTKP